MLSVFDNIDLCVFLKYAVEGKTHNKLAFTFTQNCLKNFFYDGKELADNVIFGWSEREREARHIKYDHLTCKSTISSYKIKKFDGH